MSELKVYVMPLKTNIFGKTIVGQAYYSKSDVDKVIVELKQKINEVHTELELWREGSIISETHQKELDEKRHSDYKRCLAMAKWCASERDIYNLTPRFAKMKFYTKWRQRWLTLADKYKEGNV